MILDLIEEDPLEQDDVMPRLRGLKDRKSKLEKELDGLEDVQGEKLTADQIALAVSDLESELQRWMATQQEKRAKKRHRMTWDEQRSLLKRVFKGNTSLGIERGIHLYMIGAEKRVPGRYHYEMLGGVVPCQPEGTDAFFAREGYFNRDGLSEPIDSKPRRRGGTPRKTRSVNTINRSRSAR